jgi:hypothetical protein
MDKFVIVDEYWNEEVLERSKNKEVFDIIIEQKLNKVKKIIIADPEWEWTLSMSSDKIILIN